MKSRNISPHMPKNVGNHLRKNSYTKPVLHIYGSVSELTMGNNGSNADKDNVTKKGNGPP